MIKIIYGPKGTGKTKIIIDEANSKIETAKGHLIFITNTKRYMYDLKREIRMIDTSDYQIAGEEALCGFVKGVVAANNDNEYLFIDGAARIAGKEIIMYQGDSIYFDANIPHGMKAISGPVRFMAIVIPPKEA